MQTQATESIKTKAYQVSFQTSNWHFPVKELGTIWLPASLKGKELMATIQQAFPATDKRTLMFFNQEDYDLAWGLDQKYQGKKQDARGNWYMPAQAARK